MMRTRILLASLFAGALVLAALSPATAAAPSQILDLHNWKLTIPLLFLIKNLWLV